MTKIVPKKNNNRRQGMKSWRLVVRNLPFDTKEQDLKSSFAKFGEIKEINLPKCKDNRFPNSCAGFGFIQFAKKKAADFAKADISSIELKSRKLTADWALDKDTFVTKKLDVSGHEKTRMANLATILLKNNKKEKKYDVVKKEKKNNVVKKEEEKSDSDEEKMSDSDEEKKSNFDEEEMSDSDNEKMSDSDEEKKSDFDEEEMSDSDNEKKKKEVKVDQAVNEERVVFLRNVDFVATNDSIKELASQFGVVLFAIQCHYPGTDQPCGTAFVHFKEKSSADDFLNQLLKPEGLYINGRQLFGHRAVSKENAAKFNKDTKKQPKDKRNLHLLRASLIREGTAQAREMSATDSDLRRRLAVMARNKLKDLTMFVSPTRLAIHNIPFLLNDEQLKALCLKSVKNEKASIVECRILRDKVGIDAKGKPIFGRSRGFGFVAFSDHADALKCMQNLNNNPETFLNERRPIVEFSIESLNALRTKERRLQDPDQKLTNFKTPKTEISDQRIMKRGVKRPALNDPLALQETKKSLMSGGQKWMPKRLGAKVRHRNLKKTDSKKYRLKK